MSFPFPGKAILANLVVDPAATIYLPRGADCVLRHNPIFTNPERLELSDIVLQEIPAGMTGYDYVERNSDKKFCDASILDALTKAAIEGARDLRGMQSHLSLLGQDRIIMFFGTTFLTENGQDAVAFLNLSSAVPSLRYITYMGGPMQFLPVPAYSACWGR